MSLVTRTLHLAVYGNSSKMELARYNSSKFIKYVQHFVTQLYFNRTLRLSTQGMGTLANQAKFRAQGILRAHRAAIRATQDKSNIPQIQLTVCPARIEVSKTSSFDYWISFEDSFSKKRVWIPAKSHKRLHHFLKLEWTLNKSCELVRQKNGNWQVRIFVQKEKAKAPRQDHFLGVDAGITHSISRSDGYLGKSLGPIIERSRFKDAERRRQGHGYPVLKTTIKQQLDIEARRAIARCKREGWSLAVEDPKRLANLRSGKLYGWARSYLANRATCLAEEEGVWVTYINPAYTSQTCAACGNRDRLNRVKLVFQCTICGNRTHADINASRVIAQRAQRSDSASISAAVSWDSGLKI